MRPAHPVVLSLYVQAQLIEEKRHQSQFEVLVRHLYDRLLNNEAFGEDAAVRVTQLVYAIGLPGVLVALFLFAAYHQPMPHVRSYWSQACDHLFYVTYSLVIMGMAMIFQWELLFPDILDMYVLSTLPIPHRRLLLARLLAFAIFLGLVHLGTSGLGWLFLPAVADLQCGFWRHLFAQAVATTGAAIFITMLFASVQSLLASVPSRHFGNRIGSMVRALSVIALLTILFLFPLTAHLLSDGSLLHLHGARWFPPFWFLGVYEYLLWGNVAPEPLAELAHTAAWAVGLATVIAAALYPIAYSRRMRMLIEGASVRRIASTLERWLERALTAWIIRRPRGRAIFYFAAQTLSRLPRLQLYLAMYTGLGLALVISGLMVFKPNSHGFQLAISADGVRVAVPVLAFWTVAGLRTALQSPFGQQGSWIFRVVRGSPTEDELSGATHLVRLISTTLMILTVLALRLVGPAEVKHRLTTIGQILVGVGLCFILTDIYFLQVRSIPFTERGRKSTKEVPFMFLRYLVIFPAFALAVAHEELWAESTYVHLLATAAVFIVMHLILSKIRTQLMRSGEPPEDVLFVGLGLREG